MKGSAAALLFAKIVVYSLLVWLLLESTRLRCSISLWKNENDVIVDRVVWDTNVFFSDALVVPFGRSIVYRKIISTNFAARLLTTSCFAAASNKRLSFSGNSTFRGVSKHWRKNLAENAKANYSDVIFAGSGQLQRGFDTSQQSLYRSNSHRPHRSTDAGSNKWLHRSSISLRNYRPSREDTFFRGRKHSNTPGDDHSFAHGNSNSNSSSGVPRMAFIHLEYNFLANNSLDMIQTYPLPLNRGDSYLAQWWKMAMKWDALSDKLLAQAEKEKIAHNISSNQVSPLSTSTKNIISPSASRSSRLSNSNSNSTVLKKTVAPPISKAAAAAVAVAAITNSKKIAAERNFERDILEEVAFRIKRLRDREAKLLQRSSELMGKTPNKYKARGVKSTRGFGSSPKKVATITNSATTATAATATTTAVEGKKENVEPKASGDHGLLSIKEATKHGQKGSYFSENLLRSVSSDESAQSESSQTISNAATVATAVATVSSESRDSSTLGLTSLSTEDMKENFDGLCAVIAYCLQFHYFEVTQQHVNILFIDGSIPFDKQLFFDVFPEFVSSDSSNKDSSSGSGVAELSTERQPLVAAPTTSSTAVTTSAAAASGAALKAPASSAEAFTAQSNDLRSSVEHALWSSLLSLEATKRNTTADNLIRDMLQHSELLIAKANNVNNAASVTHNAEDSSTTLLIPMEVARNSNIEEAVSQSINSLIENDDAHYAVEIRSSNGGGSSQLMNDHTDSTNSSSTINNISSSSLSTTSTSVKSDDSVALEAKAALEAEAQQLIIKQEDEFIDNAIAAKRSVLLKGRPVIRDFTRKYIASIVNRTDKLITKKKKRDIDSNSEKKQEQKEVKGFGAAPQTSKSDSDGENPSSTSSFSVFETELNKHSSELADVLCAAIFQGMLVNATDESHYTINIPQRIGTKNRRTEMVTLEMQSENFVIPKSVVNEAFNVTELHAVRQRTREANLILESRSVATAAATTSDGSTATSSTSAAAAAAASTIATTAAAGDSALIPKEPTQVTANNVMASKIASALNRSPAPPDCQEEDESLDVADDIRTTATDAAIIEVTTATDLTNLNVVVDEVESTDAAGAIVAANVSSEAAAVEVAATNDEEFIHTAFDKKNDLLICGVEVIKSYLKSFARVLNDENAAVNSKVIDELIGSQEGSDYLKLADPSALESLASAAAEAVIAYELPPAPSIQHNEALTTTTTTIEEQEQQLMDYIDVQLPHSFAEQMNDSLLRLPNYVIRLGFEPAALEHVRRQLSKAQKLEISLLSNTALSSSADSSIDKPPITTKAATTTAAEAATATAAKAATTDLAEGDTCPLDLHFIEDVYQRRDLVINNATMKFEVFLSAVITVLTGVQEAFVEATTVNTVASSGFAKSAATSKGFADSVASVAKPEEVSNAAAATAVFLDNHVDEDALRVLMGNATLIPEVARSLALAVFNNRVNYVPNGRDRKVGGTSCRSIRLPSEYAEKYNLFNLHVPVQVIDTAFDSEFSIEELRRDVMTAQQLERQLYSTADVITANDIVSEVVPASTARLADSIVSALNSSTANSSSGYPSHRGEIIDYSSSCSSSSESIRSRQHVLNTDTDVARTAADVDTVSADDATTASTAASDWKMSASKRDDDFKITNFPPYRAKQIRSDEFIPLELLKRICGMHRARVIVVGDVHGCVQELSDLLRKVEYRPGDVVLLLGDLVAKGPYSAEVVRMAMDLEAVCVRGNHDHEVVRQGMSFYRRKGLFYGTSASERMKAKKFQEHLRIAFSLSTEEFNWLSHLPYYVRSTDMGALFVHAGFVSGELLKKQEPWVMMTMRSLLPGKKPSPSCVSHLPWAQAWDGPMTVYFGHDTARGLQQYSSAVGIDTGCVYGSNLTAVLLPDKKVVTVPARMQYVKQSKLMTHRPELLELDEATVSAAERDKEETPRASSIDESIYTRRGTARARHLRNARSTAATGTEGRRRLYSIKKSSSPTVKGKIRKIESKQNRKGIK